MSRSSAFGCATFCFLVLTAAQVDGGTAQLGVQPGARVRLTEARYFRTAGRLIGIGQDSILFNPHGTSEIRSVPMANVRALEQSLGGNAQANAIRGGAMGGAIGFLAVALVKSADAQEDAKLGWALAGGVGGSLAGLFIGAVSGKERWLAVPVPNASAALPPPDTRTGLRIQMQLDSLPEGGPVQFRLFDGRRLSGSFAGRDETHARLERDSTMALPIASIQHIALRERATVTYGRRGLLIGGISVGVGVSVLALLEDTDGACGWGCLFPVAVGGGVLLGGATGLLAGTLIGALSERWQVQHW